MLTLVVPAPGIFSLLLFRILQARVVDGTCLPCDCKKYQYLPISRETLQWVPEKSEILAQPSDVGSGYLWTWQGASGGSIATPAAASTNITMAAAATYQLQVTETSSNGCVASDIQSITVVNTPSPDITPIDANVCLNEVVNLFYTFYCPSYVCMDCCWRNTGYRCREFDYCYLEYNRQWIGFCSETYLGIPGTDIVNVVVDPLPDAGLAVTAPASVCDGEIAIINVAGSQSGVTYQLREGVINIGSAVAGTGGNIGLPSGCIEFNHYL